jgi:hypothetical protein
MNYIMFFLSSEPPQSFDTNIQQEPFHQLEQNHKSFNSGKNTRITQYNSRNDRQNRQYTA